MNTYRFPYTLIDVTYPVHVVTHHECFFTGKHFTDAYNQFRKWRKDENGVVRCDKSLPRLFIGDDIQKHHKVLPKIRTSNKSFKTHLLPLLEQLFCVEVK